MSRPPLPVAVWRSLYLVNTLVRDALDARLVSEAGCTLLEHDLMAWLAAAPGKRSRMQDLARRLRITPGGLTKTVDRLVGRGWVRRETPSDNRREVHAILTEDGAVAGANARATYLRVLRATLSRHLDSTDLRTLDDITTKLVARLDGRGGERACSEPGR